MSLDVYLTIPGSAHPCDEEAIFVREAGSTRQITREDWDRLHPGREPVMVRHDTEDTTETVYSANITHNLTVMAEKAGLYGVLWRPEECFIHHAAQLVQPLSIGLHVLQGAPDYFAQFNPSNGWGSYDGLLSFVRRYYEGCRRFPEAQVSVSR